ncbi:MULTISPECIES: hypothetical protein [Serratia]|uniref:hypothetical protein n=1 Tax=Serratia TaxID=613 RepID=UPI0008A9C62C|nr:hypothetical protein [Serratia marcescens]APS37045.1 hypothetical protein RN42_25905 [Serratia marcescens]OHT35982.1 hypothetical protein BGV45_25215 [Serratia marcescens]OHT38040.1 hypothetical protein BGV46_25220 [Serratia marcescens]
MSNTSRTRTTQDTATTTQESRAKAQQSAITAIEKAFGKGAIMRLGDNHGMAVERIIRWFRIDNTNICLFLKKKPADFKGLA